jgi:phosphoketolase
MDPALMVGLKQEYDNLRNDGFRVLAVATKDLPGKNLCSKDDERELVLRGYVAFLDPPKDTAARALEGYLLTGRHGLFNCYEAFMHIVDSIFNQHAKWLNVTSHVAWRRKIASLNHLLASPVRRSPRITTASHTRFAFTSVTS